jgi:CRISPR-associated protein Cas6
MVDVVFGLAGDNLPRGFEWPLFHAIARVIPWIAQVPRAGVLPLKGPRTAEGGIMVAHRSRLVIRLPRDRVCSASALERATLRVGPATLTVGEGSFRKHQPSATLYSPRVTAGEADEVRFLARLEEELAALGVRGQLICGRRLEVVLEEGPAAAYPVAVHDLREADSLMLQRAGLGRGLAVGCGLLVPHKTIVAAD